MRQLRIYVVCAVFGMLAAPAAAQSDGEKIKALEQHIAALEKRAADQAEVIQLLRQQVQASTKPAAPTKQQLEDARQAALDAQMDACREQGGRELHVTTTKDGASVTCVMPIRKKKKRR